MTIIILGARGHAKVVADILLCRGADLLGFVDDDQSLWGTTCLGLPVLGAIADVARFDASGFALGIGDNRARQRVVERLRAIALDRWVDAIHPTAVIARGARHGRGLVAAALAVINPDARLGDHVIVNTSASVDHDCRLGDYAHVAPGAHLAADVRVGAGALVGVGACARPASVIGDWAVVGAGATVVGTVPDGVAVVGTPARARHA